MKNILNKKLITFFFQLLIKIDLMKKLVNKKSPNIVKLYEVKQSKSHYYLAMEYCKGGDLKSIIRN